jgi:hypothetical protein
MQQPDSYPDSTHPDSYLPPVKPATIGRLAAFGGLAFGVASLAGDLTIGAFPGPDTPAPQLVSFYAAHHAQVQAGGMLLALAGVFFVPFGIAVWARIRQAGASPLLAGLTMIGTALVAITTLTSAGAYDVLGGIGGQHAVAPAALQAWHIMGSAGSLADSASTFLFLVAAAGAGLLATAMPRWLAWSALALAVLQLLPDQIGFFASLVVLAWTAAAGICLLFARQGRRALPQTAYTAAQKGISHA